MKKRLIFPFVAALAGLLLTACGVLSEPEAPSATLEAVPLEVDEPAPAGEDSEPEPDVSQPLVVYTIEPGESQVRFELDEDLAGVRTTVVGVTDQVIGQLAFDLNDLSNTQVGVIQINTRTFATDNRFRNRAIQNEILETSAYEFITFTPTTIDGLPEIATIGDEINFSITGELTIRDVSSTVTFSIAATALSETQVVGEAMTTVSREAFGLTIPQVRNVANVEDAVDLTIEFVANAQ